MIYNAAHIYKMGLTLSGIGSDEEQFITENENTSALFFVNRVLCDLNIEPLENIDQSFLGNSRILDATVTGIAYYLALSATYSNKVQFLTDMYNAKRAAALSCSKSIKNTYPVI